MMVWWLGYIALGAFAGFFAGLLGIGGGSVMVPILVMLFAAQGFPSGEVMHLALGTSMAAIFFTSISSVRTHHAHGAVLWPIVARITPGIILGTLLGTHIASLVPTRALALIFLAVQLSSSGGVLPVELSGGLFAQMSPYMPITWVVKAIKVCLFGAFDDHWLEALQWVAFWGALAVLSATFVGRWRLVQTSALRPALDL